MILNSRAGGTAAAAPAYMRRDRGRVRAASEQTRGKFSPFLPGCLDSSPGLQRPGEPRLPPGLNALPTPNSKETIIIALLAWWGRTWQSVASGADDSRSSRSEGGWAPGPDVQRTSGSLARALAFSSTRWVFLLVLFPPPCLALCLLPLPSTACLSLYCMGSKI